MSIRGVLFDLNGTLLVSRDDEAAWNDWSHTLWQTLCDHAPNHDEQAFRERCGSIFASPELPPPIDGLSIYEQRIHAFCSDEGISPGTDCIRVAARSSVAAWLKYMELDPETVPLLEHLRKTCRVALVSNFDHPSYLHEHLRALGLHALFDTVLISGECGCCKPDPGIFHLALESLDLRPNEVLHVGDSDEDVLGAHAAECLPVRIRRSGEANAVDESCRATTIRSLKEILPLLAGF
jgi:HAD superfamily hydrolase (TIGR01509 family)